MTWDVEKSGPLEVVIIGGSLAGLVHGTTLKQLGHNVRILEQSSASTRSSLAAGMSTGPIGARFFEKHSRDLQPKTFAVTCPGLQYLDEKSHVIHTQTSPLNLTTWTTLYSRLRAMYDGLTSPHCPDVPTGDPRDGSATLDVGKRVVSLDYAKDRVKTPVTVHFEDIVSKYDEKKSNISGEVQADLVLDASGAFSSVRSTLIPGLKHSYAGYVAWRGTVPETVVSEATRSLFSDRFNICAMKQGYLVGYLVPGDGSSLTPGSRIINWLWYELIPESSSRFRHVMTDSEGHSHRSTLPIGKMAPEVWEDQLKRADSLTPAFRELVHLTKQPFISAVRECTPPRLSFFDGHMLLVGDCAGSLRPNAGLAFNQAALQCTLLKKVVNKEEGMTMDTWERRAIEARTVASAYNKFFANWYFAGWVSISASFLEFQAKMAWYTFRGLRSALGS